MNLNEQIERSIYFEDLHEIGHFMMSEMREQQLLETLEDTKAQLLETMDVT